MQTVKSKRLTNDEREEISRSLAQGNAAPEIAKTLGRDRTTVWREIKRGIAERREGVEKQVQN